MKVWNSVYEKHVYITWKSILTLFQGFNQKHFIKSNYFKNQLKSGQWNRSVKISAVKWLIMINRIQNKSFCLHNIICVCSVYIYYVYTNTHTYNIYFVQYIYNVYYIYNIYMYIFIFIKFILYINIFNLDLYLIYKQHRFLKYIYMLVCVCIYIYIYIHIYIYIYTIHTPILCKQKLLCWMRLIVWQHNSWLHSWLGCQWIAIHYFLFVQYLFSLVYFLQFADIMHTVKWFISVGRTGTTATEQSLWAPVQISVSIC